MDSLDVLRQTGLLAVLRAPDAERCVRAAAALVAGGVTGLEITYTTPDAPSVIRRLAEEYGDAIYLGAGTVTSAEQAGQAAAAGASFLVSPGTRPELTAALQATGRTVMTGALTPSEVMLALELGVDVVKIFPASLGGPGYLKALRGPFPDLVVMPTGGVSAANLGDWFAAGAIAVGAGGDLVPGAALANSDWDAITANARLFAQSLAAARRS